PRARALRVGWVHQGADIRPETAAEAAPAREIGLPDSTAARPGFLMVGTIEPRKGHEQVLSAFEILWAKGVDVGLMIVGRRGWMVEQFVQRLGAHPERGRRLTWLEDADDEALEALYARSSCLLAASEGEGFGLPLIEAARHGLPILARDLPVFREVAGRHARYFRAVTALDLAGALEGWLGSFAAGRHERSDGMPWLSWVDSAERLVKLLLGDGWYASWAPVAFPPPAPAARHGVEDELTGLNSEARS
ncbi:MAG: glycosyltransferase, partial [Acetobacteraceae bacterium]